MLKLRKTLQQLGNKKKEFTKKLKNGDSKETAEQWMNKFKRTLCGQKLSLDDMTQADEAIISYSQSQSLSKENACFEKRKPDVIRNRTILKTGSSLERCIGKSWRKDIQVINATETPTSRPLN